MQIIEIPIKTTSLNKIQGRHWSRAHRLKTLWDTWIGIKKRGARGPYKNVRITCHRKQLLDPDNFIGGCKQLVDALKWHDLIKDDSEKHVSIDYEQAVSKKDKTIIELW